MMDPLKVAPLCVILTEAVLEHETLNCPLLRVSENCHVPAMLDGPVELSPPHATAKTASARRIFRIRGSQMMEALRMAARFTERKGIDQTRLVGTFRESRAADAEVTDRLLIDNVSDW